MVDLNTQAMANIEAYEDGFSVVEVARDGNYTHMNMFKHLASGIKADKGDHSTEHRQARLDAMPVPRSPSDVAARLGDTGDAQYVEEGKGEGEGGRENGEIRGKGKKVVTLRAKSGKEREREREVEPTYFVWRKKRETEIETV